MATLKQKIGCWIHERSRAEAALHTPHWLATDGHSWLDLCNRNESLAIDPISGGRVCQWADSSKLTVSRIFPQTGPRLLRRCLKEWPVHLEFGDRRQSPKEPDASIVVAIGGTDRIDQFEFALASLRGQSHSAFEVIVVEQSDAPALECRLPQDVRYVYTPTCPEGFNKSRALNVAAREARGRNLVLLDADLFVPTDYVLECLKVLERSDAVRPARLLFYMDEPSTRQALRRHSLPEFIGLQEIVQNTPMPLAVRTSVYHEIGGHDERFVGWGGEDCEFLDRLRTRRVAEGGWMPAIHLWHPPAPKKVSGDRNAETYRWLMSDTATRRIANLLS